MQALSIRAPWWWFILHAGKDIENRTWRCHYRGPVLIHASKWWNAAEVADVFHDVIWRSRMIRCPSLPPITFCQMRALGGHVVGAARIVGCVTFSASPWWGGPFGMVLDSQAPLAEPFPTKGRLGFFDVPTPAGLRGVGGGV